MDARTRTHIKAIADALKSITDVADGSIAQMFTSGMLTGLATAVRIADGMSAERAMEVIEEQLDASFGRALHDGKDQQPKEQPVSADERLARGEAERDSAFGEG